jgi:hypothetical protein
MIPFEELSCGSSFEPLHVSQTRGHGDRIPEQEIAEDPEKI